VEDRWKKTVADRACDIIDENDLDPDSLELLTSEMRPESYIHELSEAKKWPDALKVMTRALPPREAVWWACVCARQLKALSDDAGELAALVSAEKWVNKPTDENRRQAFRLAQETTASSAGTLSALAAAFSGGKMPVAETDNVDLESSVFANMVDAAVVVAAVEKPSDQINDQFQCFLASGKDIACGGNGRIEEQKG